MAAPPLAIPGDVVAGAGADPGNRGRAGAIGAQGAAGGHWGARGAQQGGGAAHAEHSVDDPYSKGSRAIVFGSESLSGAGPSPLYAPAWELAELSVPAIPALGARAEILAAAEL